jgi:hypothetical protein
VDESDFDHLDDDEQPGKRPRGKPTWLLVLQEHVLRYVLREADDFVIKQNVARALNATEIPVGSCLAGLIREGILTPLQPVPASEETVTVDGVTCYWEEGKWMVRGLGGYRTRVPAVRGIRRKAKYVVTKPTKPSVAEWDGRAHFIIRGEAFHHECDRLGLPVDPRASWHCPRCGKKRDWDQIECNNYNISPPCNYKRPDRRHWPEPVKWRTCERCGTKLAPSTLHKKRHCNTIIVRGIMES